MLHSLFVYSNVKHYMMHGAIFSQQIKLAHENISTVYMHVRGGETTSDLHASAHVLEIADCCNVPIISLEGTSVRCSKPFQGVYLFHPTLVLNLVCDELPEPVSLL